MIWMMIWESHSTMSWNMLWWIVILTPLSRLHSYAALFVLSPKYTAAKCRIFPSLSRRIAPNPISLGLSFKEPSKFGLKKMGGGD
jgi:hypothetical protein